MGMQITIESDEAYRLATRLTELTGESLAAAVTEALRARLAAEQRQPNDPDREREEAWIAEATRLAAEAADEFGRGDAGPRASNHDFLYDEDGLPF